MNNMKWNEKLNIIISHFSSGIGSKFAERIGYPQAQISRALKSDEIWPKNLIESIIGMGISSLWLFEDIGPMLKEDRKNWLTEVKFDELAGNQRLFPVIGIAKCGKNGVPLEEYEELIPIPEIISKKPKLFGLRASGYSMSPWIIENDIIWFSEVKEPIDNEVMALFYDGQPMIKIVSVHENQIILESWNNNYENRAILVNLENEFIIYGKYEFSFRFGNYRTSKKFLKIRNDNLQK